MFHPLQGVNSSISIGKIERRYQSIQTYNANILYIWQNLINTNNIYSMNITKTRNLPWGFILNWFKMLKHFWQALKYFYIMWHSLIWQLACRQVIQQLVSKWTICLIIFLVRSVMLETNKQGLLFNFGEDLCYFVILQYKLCDFIKNFDGYVDDPIKGDFQKTLLLFHISRKSFMEYKWLRLHTAHKSLLGLSSMIDNQMV